MPGPLKTELEARIPWLFQSLDFHVTCQDYSPKHLGDSVAELQSGKLRLRFTRDRGTIQLEVASLSEPNRWMELGFLWYTITGYRPEPQLEGCAWFFREHLSELTDALGAASLRQRNGLIENNGKALKSSSVTLHG